MSFPEGAAAGDYPFVLMCSKLVDSRFKGVLRKPSLDHESICVNPVGGCEKGVRDLEGHCHREGGQQHDEAPSLPCRPPELSLSYQTEPHAG